MFDSIKHGWKGIHNEKEVREGGRKKKRWGEGMEGTLIGRKDKHEGGNKAQTVKEQSAVCNTHT